LGILMNFHYVPLALESRDYHALQQNLLVSQLLFLKKKEYCWLRKGTTNA
jgi:hypothetical protein